MAAPAWEEEPSHAPELQNSPIRVRMEARHRSGKKIKSKTLFEGKSSFWKICLDGSYMEVKIVAVKASKLNSDQQLSISGLQQVQHQSVTNNKIQQISIGSGIWFGTRFSTETPPFATPLDSMVRTSPTWVGC